MAASPAPGNQSFPYYPFVSINLTTLSASGKGKRRPASLNMMFTWFGGSASNPQGLFLIVCTRITTGRAQGQYVVSGIKSALVT